MHTLAATAIAATLTATAGPAGAVTELIDSQFADNGFCTGFACSDTSVAGFTASFGGNSQTPWVAKVLLTQGNCLRLNIGLVGEGSLKMAVVAPDGRTRWRADSGGTGGAGAPLITISPAPVTGYYAVVVTSADGLALNTAFHLLFGQYAADHATCASPTAPLP
jgi:hypothetical protein